MLPRLTARVSDPIDVLHTMDHAATAIGAHYIVWIEDLERFASGKPNARELTPEQSQRVAAVRALLYALHGLKSFSVVIATTELFQDFDLDKIARYVERIPEIDRFTCRRLCAHLRNRWLTLPDIVDAATRAERSDAGWPEAPTAESQDDDLLWRAFFGKEVRRVSDAVAVLCRTPRTLKQSLRRAQEIVGLLAGEIDVDDVLALCAIREANPEAFRVVVDHYHDLRSPPSRRAGDERRESPLAAFEKELALFVAVEEQRSAIRLIVQKVFCENTRPQGLKQWNDRTNYMLRFLSPHSLRDEDRDQPVLRVLAEGHTERIVAELVSGRAGIVEHFERMLSAEQTIALLVPMVDRLLSGTGASWIPSKRLPERPLPPGLVELWRMLREKEGRLDKAKLAAAVEQAVDRAVPKNLQLLHEVDHWLLTHAKELTDLLPVEVREGIQARLRARLAATYDAKPDDLIRQCEGASEFLLNWLCWGLERIRNGQTHGVPFSEWPLFAATLLESCKRNPSVMLPQLAPFVTVDARETWNGRERRFDEDRCKALFGSVSTLEPLFGLPMEPGTSDSVRAVLAFFHAQSNRPGANDVAASQSGSSPATAALLELVRAGGREDVVVPGRWFARLEDVVPGVESSSEYAVLPQDGLLAEGSSCVMLVFRQGVWLPLSETADYSFVEILKREGEAFFVPDHEPSAAWRFRLAESLTTTEIEARFPMPVAHRTVTDRKTLHVELAAMHDQGRAGDDPALAWLARNETTLAGYAGKHIAIDETGVVDADASLSVLLDRLGDGASRVTLHYVPTDEEI